MSEPSKPLGLFEGYGIELEYMIVDSESLMVRSIADDVMKSVAGEYVSDVEDGDITWSNELVTHVIELKTSGPAPSLVGLENSFARSVDRVNQQLASLGARLMPTAMHPFMNPLSETRLWPHDNNEVYEAYDRIFGCQGHGWSNLQSMHINLPFRDDREFAQLHTAIRALLPILPALAASSPMFEGKLGRAKDNRLVFYQENQKRVPSIAGNIIPDAVSSKAEYQTTILERVYRDIAPFDPDEILRDDWLNSRGAIARFGRQTIEIRVLDTQECPSADLAIAELICATLKLLIKDGTQATLLALPDQELRLIFDQTTQDAEDAIISSAAYLKALGVGAEAPGFDADNLRGNAANGQHLPTAQSMAARDIWQTLLNRAKQASLISAAHAQTLEAILKAGSLSTRLKRELGPDPSRDKIIEVYSELCDCLSENRLFLGGE